MTDDLPRPSSPEPGRDAGTGPGARTALTCCFRVLRWLRRTVIVLLLAFFAVVFYLAAIGVPRPLVERGLEELKRQGLNVEVARIRVGVLDGLAAEDVRFYETAEHEVPMLEVDKVVLGFNPSEWFDRQTGLQELQVRGAVLRVNTSGNLYRRDSPDNLVLDKVNVLLRLEPDGFRLSRVSASVLGIKVRADGFVVRETAAAAKPMTWRDFSQTLSATLRNLPRWLPDLARELNAIEFDRAPKANVTFTVYPTNPVRTVVTLDVKGANTRARGISFDQWQLDGDIRGGRLSVPTLTARHGQQRLDASASLDFATRIAEVRVSSSLPPVYWTSLIPARWRRTLQDKGFDFRGSSFFEVWAGPAPVREIPERCSGWINFGRASLGGVWVEKAFVSFKREGSLTRLTRIDAVIGQGRQRGPIRGSAWFDQSDLKFGISGSAEFDPNILLPVLPPKYDEVVQWFSFQGRPPRGWGEVTSCVTNPKSFLLSAHVVATNFSYHNAPITYYESGLGVTNGVMTLSPMNAIRPEGTITGVVAVDFDNRYADVAATSTFDAYMLGRVIGPAAERFLRDYRFEGPVYVWATGRVDYSEYERTDCRAYVEGDRMGMDWALAEHGSFHLRALGTRLDFTNIVAGLCGGRVAAWASFHPINSKTNMRYETSVDFDDVGFGCLVGMMKGTQEDEYKGFVSGTGYVAGVVGKGRGDTAVGGGRVSVRKGNLFQIPLFGGLSQILSRIYPGLGFVHQTDFDATFTLADRRAHSEDAHLGGAILSVTGVGDYYYDKHLDVNAQAVFLRGGPVATLLRFVTFPVSKMLEVHLGGTLAEPDWRPVNLPRELLFLF